MSKEFSFPFPPYPQQLGLMNAIYDCIEKCNIGCFESPTGTGKSLSVICSALKWLTEEESRTVASLEDSMRNSPSIGSNSIDQKDLEDDWLAAMVNTASSSSSDSSKIHYKDTLERYNTLIAKLKLMRTQPSTANSAGANRYTAAESRKLFGKSTSSDEVSDEDKYLLPAYDSDSEKSGKALPTDEDSDEESPYPFPQIYYCSRTHSQISQFVNEIKKTVFKDSRVVTLGSRKNLCVNSEVAKHGASESAISEACLEMQKASGSLRKADNTDKVPVKKVKTVRKSGKCEYHSFNKEEQLSDQFLAKVTDIEEMISAGHKAETCPYYASRKAVKYAQVVCMPYNILLHDDVRQSLNLSLENKVIIVDEAHNLIDSLNQIYSVYLSQHTISVCQQSVLEYFKKFSNRLSSRNIFYINLLLSVLKKLKGYLEKTPNTLSDNVNPNSCEPRKSLAISINDFLFQSGLDNINLFKLQKYVNSSNLLNRIGGYVENNTKRQLAAHHSDTLEYEQESRSHVLAPPPSKSAANTALLRSIASLRSLVSLLKCLTNADYDGKIVIEKATDSKGTSSSSISYLMLNPGVHFKSFIDEARSVVMVGGTMKPFEYFKSMLVSNRNGGNDNISKKFCFFECGHVVPPHHVKPIVITSGPNIEKLELTFSNRFSLASIQEIGRTLISLASVTPGGLVIFFGSYTYMETVVSRLKNTKVIEQLQALKVVFIEDRNRSADSLLDSYSLSIRGSKNGAILFSVIGGKLSEGINFSDDLARLVVVVGMPYPDKRDIGLQEKMKYADSIGDSGSALYDAICMKAVNQSIGRSIRHAKDYASIVLLDSRYSQTKVLSQLPNWIGSQVVVHETVASSLDELKRFFEGHRA